MPETGKKPNIAVVMPAYNAGRFLNTAVRSVLAQTYEHFCLYIVNDGSTDDTEQIAKDCQSCDSRVHFISIPNSGPAKARNTGMTAALEEPETDFLMFLDADDEYLPDAFARAVAAAENGADLVLMGFTIVNPNGTTNDYCEPDALYGPESIGQAFASLYKANLLNQVWGKLFRAQLLRENSFRFPDYRWGEDRLFIYDCLEKSKQVSVCSYCGYLYKMYNSISLISGYYDRKPEVCKLSDRRVQELCRTFRVPDDRDCRYMFLKSVFSCLTNLYSPTCHLPGEEKRRYAERILSDLYIQDRIRGTGGGLAARLLACLMATKRVTLNLMAARLMTVLSAGAPLLFQKVKHRK